MPAATTSGKNKIKHKGSNSATTPSSPKKPWKWPGKVTSESDALDLQAHLFESKSPKKIAASLKHSAVNSTRRKGTLLQSAISMLNLHHSRREEPV